MVLKERGCRSKKNSLSSKLMRLMIKVLLAYLLVSSSQPAPLLIRTKMPQPICLQKRSTTQKCGHVIPPRREYGICSRVLQRTSCRSPPTFSTARLFIIFDWGNPFWRWFWNIGNYILKWGKWARIMILWNMQSDFFEAESNWATKDILDIYESPS